MYEDKGGDGINESPPSRFTVTMETVGLNPGVIIWTELWSQTAATVSETICWTALENLLQENSDQESLVWVRLDIFIILWLSKCIDTFEVFNPNIHIIIVFTTIIIINVHTWPLRPQNCDIPAPQRRNLAVSPMACE